MQNQSQVFNVNETWICYIENGSIKRDTEHITHYRRKSNWFQVPTVNKS